MECSNLEKNAVFRLHIHTHICMYVCMCVYICVYVCVCVCVCVREREREAGNRNIAEIADHNEIFYKSNTLKKVLT